MVNLEYDILWFSYWDFIFVKFLSLDISLLNELAGHQIDNLQNDNLPCFIQFSSQNISD